MWTLTGVHPLRSSGQAPDGPGPEPWGVRDERRCRRPGRWRRRAPLRPLRSPRQAGRPVRRQVPDHRLRPVQLRELGDRPSARPDPVQPALADRPHRHVGVPGTSTAPSARASGSSSRTSPGPTRWAGTPGPQTPSAGTCTTIAEEDPDLVLVLAGDHIYKMDYRPFIQTHLDKRADLTVAVLTVPPDEASRMGICLTDDDDRIIDWEEKPAEPRGDLASMGVYVFSPDALQRWLTPARHDFGKDVVPAMIKAGRRVFAHRFDGYWRDVGTVEAFWKANLDLVGLVPPLDLFDRDWLIHTRSEERSPAKSGPDAVFRHSLVSHGCIINGTVVNSLLSPGVQGLRRRRRPRLGDHARRRDRGRGGRRRVDRRQARHGRGRCDRRPRRGPLGRQRRGAGPAHDRDHGDRQARRHPSGERDSAATSGSTRTSPRRTSRPSTSLRAERCITRSGPPGMTTAATTRRPQPGSAAARHADALTTGVVSARRCRRPSWPSARRHPPSDGRATPGRAPPGSRNVPACRRSPRGPALNGVPRPLDLTPRRRPPHTRRHITNTGLDRDEYPAGAITETRRLVRAGMAAAANGPGSPRTERGAATMDAQANEDAADDQ